MSLILHVKSFKSSRKNLPKYVYVEFRNSSRYGIIRKRVDEFLLMNEVFIWNLDCAISVGEILEVNLLDINICQREKKAGQYRLALDALTAHKPLVVQAPMMKADIYCGATDPTLKYRTWCGLCAICERMFGRFQPRSQDPPDGIELSDFSMVENRLAVLKVHKGLVEVLNTIIER